MPYNKTIPWNDKYSLGIDAIDTQHKKLFEIVNRLYALDDEHSTKDEIKDILYEFNDYLRTHLSEEEEYMASINFPELPEHKEIHESFIVALTKIITTPAKLDIIKTKMKVFAKRALIDHITHKDIKIKYYKMSLEAPSEKITNIE